MHTLVIGSRVHADKQGINFFSFDEHTGALQHLSGFGGVEYPNFQCFDREKRILYTVSETETDGHVYAYRVSPALTCEKLFCVPSQGDSPCHLALEPTGKGLAVANYADGVFTFLGFGRPDFIETFPGKGKHPNRQQSSHIHSSLWLEAGKSLLVADLGLDRIIWYTDSFTRKHYITVPAGTGPRHLALSLDQGTLFVASELSNEVLVIQLGPEPSVVQTISTLPADFLGENTVADIHLSSDQRFLYCSNRGHNSIAMYALDLSTSSLTLLGHCMVEQEPRNFCISPSDSFVLVGNAGSNSVTVHVIDQITGLLSSAMHRIELIEPVCLTFFD
ncbi:lactonase family protein [Sphaerochaeta globosa]|uniref:Lactonase, 7-bladed beta propeller n=1 Tax=Sphaerochaeta globosa (strain ATCC BAA-1886 / DSM 22777 / Buddy) TaxID=158189 RepID=F0RZB0_SPHGB|nr:lactonase family protein [Sphaerochaeta globosa]ADY13391.1 Lactonase, 7-bladed beta propeller [Sphaerochaeta globosa str. Buddy]